MSSFSRRAGLLFASLLGGAIAGAVCGLLAALACFPVVFFAAHELSTRRLLELIAAAAAAPAFAAASVMLASLTAPHTKERPARWSAAGASVLAAAAGALRLPAPWAEAAIALTLVAAGSALRFEVKDAAFKVSLKSPPTKAGL
jgi:hypothetical protein